MQVAKQVRRAQHAVPLRIRGALARAVVDWNIEERFLDCVSRRFAQEQKPGTLRSERRRVIAAASHVSGALRKKMPP